MKRIRVVPMILAALAVLCAFDAAGQLVWTKDPHNPVLSGGGRGTWNQHLINPCVLFNEDSSRFEMWFNATPTPPEPPVWGHPWSIGFATSKDGISWTVHPEPVLSHGVATWDEGSVVIPAVIRENKQYKMWYSGWSLTSPLLMGYATSPDGIHWTKYANNPITSRGPEAWELGGPWGYTIMPDSGGYKMWYGASDAPNQHAAIGYATSSDGIIWRKDTLHNPVFSPAPAGQWDDHIVTWPMVLRINSVQYMLYQGSNGPDFFVANAGLALSSNGVTDWTRVSPGPVFTISPGAWDGTSAEAATIVLRGDTLHMWYDGAKAPVDSNFYRIGHATLPLKNLVPGTRRFVPQQYATIQSAIDSAMHGDTVLVSEGTYYENINFKGKAIVVASHMILNLQDTTARNHTVINGSRPSDTSKGSVVSFVSGEDTSSAIFGFTLTGGTGTVSLDNSRVGGGVFCFNSAARIAHNKILDNSISHSGLARGGGIGTFPFQNGFYTVIEHNIIQSNSCFGQQNSQGGGIYMPHGRIDRNILRRNICQGGGHSLGGGIHGASDPDVQRQLLITHNTIDDNQAVCTSQGGYGGGIDIYGGIVVRIIADTIRNNHASDPIAPLGGGMRLRYTLAPSTVRENVISCNSVSRSGGGGGIGLAETRGITILDNVFEGNSCGYGGGVSESGSWGTVIQGNDFVGNSADTSGGGFYSDQSTSSISGNLFKLNRAFYGGAGMCAVGNYTWSNNIIVKNRGAWGGGLFYAQMPSQPFVTQIINNTIVDNAANMAGAIALLDAKTVLMNTIAWGDTASFAPEIHVQGGELHIGYSDICFGKDSIAVTDGGTLNWLDNNIIANPQFLDTTMRLGDSSPCIGAGIDSMSISGIWFHAPPSCFYGTHRPSPDEKPPDIGACENLLGEPTSSVGESHTLPTSFVLEQNYPNPFNPTTTVSYQLPQASHVRLCVYDLLGREVAVLVNERKGPGSYTVTFDASGLASGVYLYRLTAGSFVQTRKMIVVR